MWRTWNADRRDLKDKNPYRETLASQPPEEDDNALTESDLAALGKRAPAPRWFWIPDIILFVAMAGFVAWMIEYEHPVRYSAVWRLEYAWLMFCILWPGVTTLVQYFYVKRRHRYGLTSVLSWPRLLMGAVALKFLSRHWFWDRGMG